MEVTMTVNGWHLFLAIVSVVGSFSVNTYLTNMNNKRLNKYEEKVKNVVSWDEARKTFVTKELYENQMEHIDNALGELKEQNREILSHVRK